MGLKFLTPLIQKLASNRLLTLALILSGLFVLARLLGLQEYTNILSGTGALTTGRIFSGLLYLGLYVCIVGIVPILLIAAALRFGIQKSAGVFSRKFGL